MALTEIQVEPKFETTRQGLNEVLSGQVIVNISQYQDQSELVVEFIGISNQELGLDRKVFNIEMFKRQNKAMTTKQGIQLTIDLPKTSHYQSQYLGSERDRTLHPNAKKQMQQAQEHAEQHSELETTELKITIQFSLDNEIPDCYLTQIVRS